jgi:hypothetical protein
MSKYEVWREREAAQAQRIEDAIERRRIAFIDAKVRALADVEDERERRREKRVADYREYLRTGIVQSGQGIRVPLLMSDSDKDTHWVMPVDHPLHATHARPMPERIIDESPSPKFDPRMHQPGYRTAQLVADSLASLVADRSGDSVEVSRAWRRSYYRDAWKDKFLSAGGGQAYLNVPTAAVEEEQLAESVERGADSDADIGKVRDAARAAKLKWLSDQWKNSGPPVGPPMVTPKAAGAAAASAKADEGDPRNRAYSEKLARQKTAWGGGQGLTSRSQPEGMGHTWRLGHI